MIKETVGNLFEANTEALVNAVNCVGVMGKGIALQFKQKFPKEYFNDYKKACQNGELAIGRVQIFQLKDVETNPRFIVNFPTKNHWREQSKIEYIKSGLHSLVKTIEHYEIRSIAMPALGCGLGGLNFKDVRHLIKTAFDLIPKVEIFLYKP